MSRRKVLAVLAGCSLLAACRAGDGTGVFAADPEPITFRLQMADTGHVLRIRPGDAVQPTLPLTGPGDPGWVLASTPDPRVLGGGDDLRVFPQEAGEEGAPYHEFHFVAVGTGETTVVLTHGFQRFTVEVQVAPDD